MASLKQSFQWRRDAPAELGAGGSVTGETDSGPRVVIRDAGRPGDLGWMVLAHGEIYAAEFGWDTDFEALVARIVADYAAGRDPAREAGWIAELDGRRAGCILCVAAGPSTAKLRILLVDPQARGHGIGHRLVDTCLDFARGAGYPRMQLWTHDVLTDARSIYVQRGFRLVAQERYRRFGADLVSQTYETELAGIGASAATGSAR
jgi:GNAT superfamily N-acetyltransferase